MELPWKYTSNTFLVQTVGTYKLMNIVLSDHVARLGQTLPGGPDPVIIAQLSRTQIVKSSWDAAYASWIAARGIYKGKTLAMTQKLADLSSLKVKQWDIAIQGSFLEGTPEYTQLLPNGRGPFQSGAYDLRLAEVKALQLRLANFAPLAALATTVGTYYTEMKTLRDAQQSQEGVVDTTSALTEVQRVAAAVILYKNLGGLMEKFADNPSRVEDFFDMNYLRDGAATPPEDEPAPPVPPVI